MKEQPISYPRLLPRNLPGFDIEAAVARMMGRVDLWWQVLAVFHVRFADCRDAWRQTQAQADREGERKCVHALRSAAANIGAARLAAAAAALESLLMASEDPMGTDSARTLLLECLDEAQHSAAEALGGMVSPPSKAP